jgi:hypothetical protein
METTKEQNNIIKSGLYSSKQLFIATIIGGTTIAGFILAFNLWSAKKKLATIIPVVLGLISEIVLMLPGYFTIRHIQSHALRNILAIALLVLLQTVQFSGHTHYGQIWPLNYFTKAAYDIAWGYKKIYSTHFFVSCGAHDAILPGRQDMSIPVRIGSVSEIMEVDIAFK